MEHLKMGGHGPEGRCYTVLQRVAACGLKRRGDEPRNLDWIRLSRIAGYTIVWKWECISGENWGATLRATG